MINSYWDKNTITFRNTRTAFGQVAKCFHWVIAALVIAMLIYGLCLDAIPEQYKGIAMMTHKLTGLLILTLVVSRIIWALINPKPALQIETFVLQRTISQVTHYLLYIGILVMPCAGWIGSVAAGRAPYLGKFVFNLPIQPNKIIASIAFQVHNTLAFILIGLISLHILAALWHHFILKDNILKRMLF